MPGTRPVRRNQLVSTFGIGSMIDLPRDESLMVAGLDAWPYARDALCPSEWAVQEERLAARLRVHSLRLPPDYRESQGVQNGGQRIPAVRFPRWHYCPRCGAMERLPLFRSTRTKCHGRPGFSCSSLPERRRPFLIPVRIVAVCPAGHIEDFPFDTWAHGAQSREQHQLKYEALGSSAALSGIVIRCMDCHAKRTLAGAFDYDQERGGPLSRFGHVCSGLRPWLGEHEHGEACAQHLRVLQRGASNVYFPQTVSSIYLPLWGEGSDPAIVRIIEDAYYWEILSSGLLDGSRIDPAKCAPMARHFGVDTEALRVAAQRRIDGVAAQDPLASEEEFRRSEYEAFIAGRGGESTDLLVEVIGGGEYTPPISHFIRRVCLVRKLRETRAISGFTRVLPPEDPSDPRIQPLSSRRLSWLPATVVRGEGIFIEFDEGRLRRWQAGAFASRRAADLAAAYNRKRQERGQPDRVISAKFILLHTFAHLLIKQLSFDCGYGSASLRERLYCESEPDSAPMQGLLIYTASGDSEGTLGGLVRQGEPGRLEPIIMEAVRSASWCSSDPVCIESPGQGADSANLAACHGCALVSETSCEEGNRLLDRGTLVGPIWDRTLGFLTAMAEE